MNDDLSPHYIKCEGEQLKKLSIHESKASKILGGPVTEMSKTMNSLFEFITPKIIIEEDKVIVNNLKQEFLDEYMGIVSGLVGILGYNIDIDRYFEEIVKGEEEIKEEKIKIEKEEEEIKEEEIKIEKEEEEIKEEKKTILEIKKTTPKIKKRTVQKIRRKMRK